MKHVLVLSILAVLAAALSGCTLIDPPIEQLTVVATPSEGYPPLVVMINASGPSGGWYVFTVEGSTFQRTTGSLQVTIQRLPCVVQVVWTNGRSSLVKTVTVGLVNEGPVIGRPVLGGIVNRWVIIPKWRYVVTFPDAYDPEGGPVTLVDASVRTIGTVSEPNTVFCPPYIGADPPKPDVYHVLTGAGIVENAFVFYSIWNGPLDVQSGSSTATNLPFPPPDQSEMGYPGGVNCSKSWPREARSDITTIIRATFEDEAGARTTREWSIPTSPYPGC